MISEQNHKNISIHGVFFKCPPPESSNYENDEGSGGGQLKETPCIYVRPAGWTDWLAWSGWPGLSRYFWWSDNQDGEGG